MKKIFLSLLGGLILGVIISVILWDYQSWNYEIQNYYGTGTKEVKEWDFEFLTNATSIIIVVSILIFLIWTFIEKKSKD